MRSERVHPVNQKNKKTYLAVLAVLIVVLIIVAAVTLARGPRTSPAQVLSNDAAEGTMVIDDINDGNLTIPKYDIATSAHYKTDQFVEENGVITYKGGESALGISVNQNMGDVDWAKVKESGVEFAMIRAGYRETKKGRIVPDANFEANMKGAADAGIQVGVYFFSQAVTDAEADEEISFVLQQIQGYQVTYPIAIDWEFKRNSDGTIDDTTRTAACTGEQITGFINTFCNKASKAGFTACYFADKTMGYEELDLSKLSSYDLWYGEYKSRPSFYYDFKMWQYTDKGSVAGIEKEVPINIALKSYGG